MRDDYELIFGVEIVDQRSGDQNRITPSSCRIEIVRSKYSGITAIIHVDDLDIGWHEALKRGKQIDNGWGYIQLYGEGKLRGVVRKIDGRLFACERLGDIWRLKTS